MARHWGRWGMSQSWEGKAGRQAWGRHLWDMGIQGGRAKLKVARHGVTSSAGKGRQAGKVQGRWQAGMGWCGRTGRQVR